MKRLAKARAVKLEVLEQENERLRTELIELRERLREPEEILRAIRGGEVDGFVIQEGEGEAIYQLRSADVLCRLMIEDMKEGAFAIDDAGNLLYCNRCFARLLGMERDDILGARVQRFLAPEARPLFQDLLVRAHGGSRAEIELQAVNGARLPAALSVQVLSVENATVYGVVVNDLTRERLQEQLAVEARRKDEFLAILGHELRGPLAPIQNAVHLLQLGGPRDADLKWARDIIDRQVRHMARLVDDLLDLGRIGQGKLDIRLDEHDVALLVARAVETSRPLFEARGQRLELVQSGSVARALVDPDRMTQVIGNLLNNAAKFTPPAGRVVVTSEVESGHAVIRVRDSGVGIPPDRLRWIFDLFAQLETDSDRSAGGLGIGLALVRRLVEMHGGTVEALSDGPGAGSEFVVRLPLTDAATKAKENPARIGEKPGASGPSSPTVVRRSDRAPQDPTVSRDPPSG